MSNTLMWGIWNVIEEEVEAPDREGTTGKDEFLFPAYVPQSSPESSGRNL